VKIGKLAPLAVLTAAQELHAGANDRRPLAIDGPPAARARLAHALRAGGDEAAVIVGSDDSAAALVWVGRRDRKPLRDARRAGITVVHVGDPGAAEFDVAAVATEIAEALGADATSLAARLPVLRPAVSAHLISSFSRHNGWLAAAIFVPGVDLPVLTLNQVRLVLRLALAHGQRIDGRRAIELLGVVGAGLGFRAVAREALGVVPVAGWAVKGAIAYTGTKALGEAAVRYFAARSA
jgi:uncharacterized protein (DUF697 family)